MNMLPDDIQEQYGLTKQLKHATISEIINYAPTSKEYYKFCVVRNPWERTVSTYKWALRYKEFSRMTFRQFVDIIQHHQHDTSHSLNKLTTSQTNYITHDGKNVMDAVVSFSKLKEDLVKVEDSINMLLPITVLNASANKTPYQTYYTPDLKDKVRELYAEDFELGNWEFE